MSVTGIVRSIQVGLPAWHGTSGATDPMDKPFSTGFWKSPVSGPVEVSLTNLHGDGQADLVNHGGPDKAVLGYSADHYPAWTVELARGELPFGGFGENLTIVGLSEADVCIGDIWEIADVQLQISQPRQPCWKLARRWRIKNLPARVVETGRSGWYYRVVRTGKIESDLPLVLIHRPNPEWTVQRANHIMHFHKYDPDESRALAEVPELSASWRDSLIRRANG